MTPMAEAAVDLEWHALSVDEVRQFDEQGYLVVRNVLDRAMVELIIEASDRLISSNRRENRTASDSGLFDGFRNCIALDDGYIALLTHPKVLSFVVQLLGAHLQLMTSQLIYQNPCPPSERRAVRKLGWHRDYGAARKIFGDRVPRIMLKCAFYLTDLSEPNSGATLVVPGSNHDTEPIMIPEGENCPVGYIEPSLRAGDCLFFENRIAHAAGANLTDRTRKAVMFGYGYRWVMPMDYRAQKSALLHKLDFVGRYLVGERYPEVVEYRPGGGESPLAPWGEAHGAPAVRPYGS